MPNVQRYILRLLAHNFRGVGQERPELSPVCIARNIGYKDNDYVGENCRLLVEAGFLEKSDDGPYYTITDEGEAFLASEQ